MDLEDSHDYSLLKGANRRQAKRASSILKQAPRIVCNIIQPIKDVIGIGHKPPSIPIETAKDTSCGVIEEFIISTTEFHISIPLFFKVCIAN